MVQERLLKARSEPENWLTYYGAYNGQRYSPLDEVNRGNVKRLRRIEGQVRGLQRMVEEDRYCADIMTQISSVHEALRSVGAQVIGTVLNGFDVSNAYGYRYKYAYRYGRDYAYGHPESEKS